MQMESESIYLKMPLFTAGMLDKLTFEAAFLPDAFYDYIN